MNTKHNQEKHKINTGEETGQSGDGSLIEHRVKMCH